MECCMNRKPQLSPWRQPRIRCYERLPTLWRCEKLVITTSFIPTYDSSTNVVRKDMGRASGGTTDRSVAHGLYRSTPGA